MANSTFNNTEYNTVSTMTTVAGITITFPFWYNNVTNFTLISAGQNGLFNVTWNATNGLSGYIFSINDSGQWVNQSFTKFSGTTNVSSVAWTINTTRPKGNKIGW